MIRSRHSIQIQKGNTVEVIQQNSIINTKIKELEVKFAQMKEIFKRNVKQRGKVRMTSVGV